MSDEKLDACQFEPSKDESTPSLVVVVGDLLEQSRAAHLVYRQYAGRCDKKGNITHPYDEARCERAVELALSKRREAHALDPDHLDPAWKLDTAEHEQLVKFYQDWLRKP